MLLHNVKELAAQVSLGETIECVSRAVYKGTSCGAWVKESGVSSISIGSIVEGCDFDAETQRLTFPFTEEQFWSAVKEVEDSADYIWQQTHGCDDCGVEGEWGHPAINPSCTTCGGEGTVI